MATAEAKTSNRKLKPINDKIVVQKAEPETKTDGGIYLPSSSQEKPLEGIVIAVGPGPRNDKGERQELQIKEGERVLYSKYSGTEFKQNGKELLIISEKDILAIIEG
ncbi:MAG: co-chaperone GroES [Cyanobacteria bacterium]|nr:co-chaperone GroES [Cyanobacteriota bacterium]MDA1020022.1 co-chaperone GroES [Cyanobacteriota bacterium]